MTSKCILASFSLLFWILTSLTNLGSSQRLPSLTHLVNIVEDLSSKKSQTELKREPISEQDSKRMLMLLSVGCCVNRHLLANPFAMFTSWGDHSLFCHTQVAKIINSNNQSLAFPFCGRKVFGQLLVANQFPFFSIWNSHNAPHILDDSLQGEGYALSLSPCLWVCTGCRCHASCWCIVRYGFLLASGVLGDGRGGGGGQRRTGSKLAQPSAPHMGTNTPLNHGLHILL